MTTKVLLVDDHGMIRSGLRALLQATNDIEVVGEASEGRTAVETAAAISPQVVVMDLSMPDMNGIEATRQLTQNNPNVKIVGLSANSDRHSVVQMLRAGAKGYVCKESAFEELALAIRTVMTNKVHLSPGISSAVLDGWADESDNHSAAFGVLSGREREVLQLIAEGKATKEVASKLSVSVKTVETHRRNLMEKLHVDSVAELTKYAIREGITEL